MAAKGSYFCKTDQEKSEFVIHSAANIVLSTQNLNRFAEKDYLCRNFYILKRISVYDTE